MCNVNFLKDATTCEKRRTDSQLIKDVRDNAKNEKQRCKSDAQCTRFVSELIRLSNVVTGTQLESAMPLI